MAKIYYKKIVDGDINKATGKAWELDDVPMKWREDVRKMLEDKYGVY